MAVASRRLDDLAPSVKAKALRMLGSCEAVGLDVVVACTYRDSAAQAALYASGRTVKGPILTNAKPGQSLHNYVDRSFEGLEKPASKALDVYPLLHGKLVRGVLGNDLKLWRQLGEIGEACGLQWAGRWTGALREFAHFQSE